MNPYPPAVLAVVASYLIGAIPFAYLVVSWVKGVDIRTVGSGNVGATNAGRVLGFRYFLLVFALDLLKGLLPTLGLPALVAAARGRPVEGLAVLVAMGTILGHNFPVYLRFRGGKGVATSLGAMFALDAVASGASMAAFVVALRLTRYVSVSSVVGGLVFAAVSFARARGHAWDANHRALSLLIIGLLGMLIVRHRKNFMRIAAGTEPKVDFRKRKSPPGGRVMPVVVIGLAALAAVAGLVSRLARTPTLDCGPFTLIPVTRADTGHQRAGRLTFADGGNLLAVGCPRYNRVVLYRVTAGERLEVVRDIPLEGRPVAIVPLRDRLVVLERPTADARHVEAGWWETFDFRGMPVGERFRVGFDPDDLAFAPDGRHAYVLLSGRAEGESNRPAPALVVVDLGSKGEGPRAVARVEFDRPGDDPERLTLSASGHQAVVTLDGTNEAAAIDLSGPNRPTILGRSSLAGRDWPYPSASADDWVLMPPSPGREAVWVAYPGGSTPRLVPTAAGSAPAVPRGSFLVGLVPEGSALEVLQAATRRPLGRLPLRGAGNLGGIRPSGLAYSADRGLLAVSNRQGGSVHLIAIRPKDGPAVAFRAPSGSASR